MKILRLLSPLLFLVFAYQGVLAQCAGIRFSSKDTLGCAPLIAKFQAINYPVGSDFSWDFGAGYSGRSSSDSVKTNIFNTAGNYTVKLRVYLQSGTICNFTKNNNVMVTNKPVAQFITNKVLLCNGGDTVTFTDITPKSMSRDWLIDGVQYLNAPKTIKHYFKLPGYKSVLLQLRDTIGCIGLVNMDSVVNVVPSPTLNFSADSTHGCAPQNVTFSPTITGLLGQTITSYSWTLPGSSIPLTATQSPAVVYASQGSFDVTLTITTSLGCSYSITKTGYINIGSTLTINFQANSTSICRGQVVRLVNTTVGLPLPGKFRWVLPVGASIIQGDTFTDTVYVKFGGIGSYDIQLQYLYNGCGSNKTALNYITLNPPLANFTSVDRVNCTFPDTVQFSNTSLLPATGTNTYSWTVYDVNKVTVLAVSTLQNPSFIINKFGRFDVRLIVSNSNGCSDTLKLNNYIVVDTATGNFIAYPLVACPGQPILFTNSTPLFSNKATPRYKWTFYTLDSIHTFDYSLNGYDTLNSLTVKYDTVGQYNVLLQVSNRFGCGDTTIKYKFITIGTPVANFSASDSNICAGSQIIFIQQTEPRISTLFHRWKIQHADSSNISITGSGSPFWAKPTVPGIYHLTYTADNGIYCKDSITKNNFLHVSGIKGKTTASANSGCSQSTINFSSTIDYNFHFVNPSAVVQYSWSCVPISDGATLGSYNIGSPGSVATDITFTHFGKYRVYCEFTNSEGCHYIDSAGALIIAIGAQALFSIAPEFCKYDTATLLNSSTLNPVSYKWFSDGAISFLPNDSVANPKLVFSQTGYRMLGLIAKTANGCVDTMIQNIVISQPIANFIASDTAIVCGPALVTFHSRSSSDVTIYTWDFGDGSPPLKSTDTVISHVFAIKNGLSSFNVTLQVENNIGCVGVMTKQNFIRITGPVPYFKITNTKGCEPVSVHIVDSSRFVHKFYFSYGFGPIDSVSITDKIYTLASPNVLYSVYKPYLFVFDTSGVCSQIYQPLDSIVVYSRPKAWFYVKDSSSCLPFIVNFFDTSKAATRWRWDFNNDGFIDDTTQNPTYIYTTPGKYGVKLIVTNQFGCTDTMLKTNYIEAFEKPVAKFVSSDTAVCPHTVISFLNQSTFAAPIVKYHWDFGVPTTLADTSDLANPIPYKYDITGVYTVSLYLEDVNGCNDLLVKTNMIKVADSLPPSQPQIYYITVVNNNDIRVIWNKNTASDFTFYNLYRSVGGMFTPLISKNLITDTSYLDNAGINVKTQPYSYTMDALDNCGHNTAFSITHRSIYLDATTLTQNSNLITWTSYQGWAAGTFVYKLYRSHTLVGGYLLYAQHADFDTTLVDANLCDSDYYYYVEAWQVGTGFISRSNIDFNHPPYYIANTPLEVIRATVVNDKDVLLEWDTSGVVNTNRKIYFIDKLNAGGTFQNIASSTSNSYIDKLVDVHSNSYTYRVRMQDYCGYINPGSNIGRSINLRALTNGYSVYLSWNAYDYWANTVQAYILELYDNKNKTYQVVSVLPPTDTTYTDTKFYEIDTASCYRIRAVEAQSLPDTSMSNLACVFLPPNIVVPNAFSPNNDGVNDIFYAQGVFIQNLTGKPPIDYMLRIFDRWGSLLFETNDFNKGWDGNYNERACDVGVYVYELRATGYNKQRFNYKGTFHLLR